MDGGGWMSKNNGWSGSSNAFIFNQQPSLDDFAKHSFMQPGPTFTAFPKSGVEMKLDKSLFVLPPNTTTIRMSTPAMPAMPPTDSLPAKPKIDLTSINAGADKQPMKDLGMEILKGAGTGATGGFACAGVPGGLAGAFFGAHVGAIKGSVTIGAKSIAGAYDKKKEK